MILSRRHQAASSDSKYSINQMGTENRSLEQNLSDLITHIQNGMISIQREVEGGYISEEMGQALLQHQQAELDFLSQLPPEITFKQVMENHFKLIRDENSNE